MGLLDWLTGRKDKFGILADRIWLTERTKHDGIQREIAQAIADPAGPCVVIVVAHFTDCLERLRAAAARLDSNRVFLIPADALANGTPTSLAIDESQYILVVVGERHPLPSHNEVVVNFARSLACRCQVVHHISLEDPIMRRFSGDWTRNVLRGLGMKEGEAIESRMVNRRIQSELKKIARNAMSDLQANSAEEWLGRNCPSQ